MARSTTTLQVLVDYDNILGQDRRRGPHYVAEAVLGAIDFMSFGQPRRIRFRLYGGWDHGGTLTRRAQDLNAELTRDFPFCRTILSGGIGVLALVNAELAMSLELEPGFNYANTYRPHYSAREISCRDPISTGCTHSPCAMLPVYNYFLTRACPNNACAMQFDDLFKQPTQKMVDSMILADLLFFVLQGEEQAVVVGSDDDLWPAIRLGLAMGARIAHVHTRPGRRTPAAYISNRVENYVQLNF